MQQSGGHWLPRQVRLRQELEGLKAAQAIEATAARAQEIGKLEVELQYLGG